MSKIQKLISRIQNNKKTVRFEDLDKVVERHGFKSRQHGTADVFYYKGEKGLVVPKPHGNAKYVKPVYVRKALEALQGEPLVGEEED